MQRPVRIWLIIESILAVPAVLAGGFMAIMSPMMFDAPGSTDNPAILALFFSVIAFPLACIVGVLAGWIAFARKRDRLALWLSLLPLIPLVTGVIAAIGWS
jgi:ABC-type Fe3+ transport system permease subunit